MRKILGLIALLLGLAPAAAQVPGFPQTLPANTVVGRLGTGSGPSQAIPFSVLTAQLLSQVGISTPLIVGGSLSSSTLTLESTSGAGTTDAIIFKVGSQVERARLNSAGTFEIGGDGTFLGTLGTGVNKFQILG